MALVEEDAVDDALDGLVERRVVEHDVGRLAAELEAQALAACRRRLRWISLPTSVEPVNAILSMPSCSTSACPIAGPPASTLTTPGGRSASAMISASSQRGQRRRLGGLEHDGVAGRERGRDLPGGHQQREVPRNDLPGHTERSRRGAEARVLELVGPARVVEEVRGRQRDVDVARLADRLAVVERLEHRQFAAAFLDRTCDAEQVLRRARAPGSRARRLRRPGARPAPPRRRRPLRPRRHRPAACRRGIDRSERSRPSRDGTPRPRRCRRRPQTRDLARLRARVRTRREGHSPRSVQRHVVGAVVARRRASLCRCSSRSLSRLEAPKRKRSGSSQSRAGDLVDHDQVADRLLARADAAGELHAATFAGRVGEVAHRLAA